MCITVCLIQAQSWLEQRSGCCLAARCLMRVRALAVPASLQSALPPSTSDASPPSIEDLRLATLTAWQDQAAPGSAQNVSVEASQDVQQGLLGHMRVGTPWPLAAGAAAHYLHNSSNSTPTGDNSSSSSGYMSLLPEKVRSPPASVSLCCDKSAKFQRKKL